MLSPMDVLPESRQRAGDGIELYVDSGIRRGSDIVKALALGADACSIGRPYLYGLAAAGSPGVTRVIEILADELQRTMTLVGVSSIAELKEQGTDIVREIGTWQNVSYARNNLQLFDSVRLSESREPGIHDHLGRGEGVLEDVAGADFTVSAISTGRTSTS